jgi:hypothetical protein
MRKHPLIALIAFTCSAVLIFIGTAGASNFTSVPVRAISHSGKAENGSSATSATDLRWFATKVQDRARLLASIKRAQDSPYWQGRAADFVAIHDMARPTTELLPSAWRQMQRSLARAAAAREAAAAYASAVAAQEAQAAQAAQEAQAAQAVASPPPAASGGGGLGGGWLALRMCESGDNYGDDTGNGYYGAYQFALSTWWGLGYSGLPSNAPPAVQDQAAQRLQAASGWRQWPSCAAELEL